MLYKKYHRNFVRNVSKVFARFREFTNAKLIIGRNSIYIKDNGGGVWFLVHSEGKILKNFIRESIISRWSIK